MRFFFIGLLSMTCMVAFTVANGGVPWNHKARLLKGKNACVGVSQIEECSVFGSAPTCMPYRSTAFCAEDESFPSYIQKRFLAVKNDPQDLTGNYWFPALDEKLAAYKFSASLGLNPPKLYECTDDIYSIESFSDADAFVVRAKDLHSNYGVYVFPKGFDNIEVIRDQTMSAFDVINDLRKMNVTSVLIEQYVGSDDGLPLEFKFHMFPTPRGPEVGSVNVVANRHSESCACWAEMDADQTRLDGHGCFTPGESEQKVGDCTAIDFHTGAKKAFPMKGMNICSDLKIDECLFEEMISQAKKAAEAIGVYIRVDFFLGSDNRAYVQEFSTNHMNGLRHCSAKIDENGCIDPCYQGTMWKEAGGDATFGGSGAPTPDFLKEYMDAPDKCSNIMATAILPPPTTSCAKNSSLPDASDPPSTTKGDSPSDAPSVVPTPAEVWSADTPIEPVLPGCEGPKASFWGDPHITTFDKKIHDCQGIGEFVVIKNDDASDYPYEVQARFEKHWEKSITLIEAVVVKHADDPIVQVGFAETPVATTREYSVSEDFTCHIDLYVGGERLDVVAGYEDDKVDVTETRGAITIVYKDSGLTVALRPITRYAYWDCYFSTYVCLDQRTPALSQGVVGLLGTPNGDDTDEWMNRNGTTLTSPTSTFERMGRPAYNYCTGTWCVETFEDSLFTYEPGKTHTDYYGCDIPYPGDIDICSPPDGAYEICGPMDDPCLYEATMGGETAGIVSARGAFDDNQLLDYETNKCTADIDCFQGTCANGQCVCDDDWLRCPGDVGKRCERKNHQEDPANSGPFACTAGGKNKCTYFQDFESFSGEHECYWSQGGLQSNMVEATYAGDLYNRFGQAQREIKLKVNLGVVSEKVLLSFDFFKMNNWDFPGDNDVLKLIIHTGNANRTIDVGMSKLANSTDVLEGTDQGVSWYFTKTTDNLERLRFADGVGTFTLMETFQRLEAGRVTASATPWFELSQSSNGTLVLYEVSNPSIVLWSAPLLRTDGEALYAALQGDGHFIVRDEAEAALWYSGAPGVLGSYFLTVLVPSKKIAVFSGTPAVPGDMLWSDDITLDSSGPTGTVFRATVSIPGELLVEGNILEVGWWADFIQEIENEGGGIDDVTITACPV